MPPYARLRDGAADVSCAARFSAKEEIKGRGTHLSFQENVQRLPHLRHLQHEEMQLCFAFAT